MTTKQEAKIIKLLEDIEIYVSEGDLLELENQNEVHDFLRENGHFDVEIIYYSRAIEYLKEHDSSLRESLEIANDLGYSLTDLSSEVLASLLASQVVEQDYSDIMGEVEEILEEGE